MTSRDDSNDVLIREASPADLGTVLAFEQGVVRAERPFTDVLKDGEVHYYDVAALIESSQTMLLVAELNGELVGTGHATLKQSLEYLSHDRHAYLGLMYVTPECRGQGIVQQIIDKLVEWAKSKGIDECYLDVYSANEPAVRAYEKYGFRKNLVEMKLHLK